MWKVADTMPPPHPLVSDMRRKAVHYMNAINTVSRHTLYLSFGNSWAIQLKLLTSWYMNPASSNAIRTVSLIHVAAQSPVGEVSQNSLNRAIWLEFFYLSPSLASNYLVHWRRICCRVSSSAWHSRHRRDSVPVLLLCGKGVAAIELGYRMR